MGRRVNEEERRHKRTGPPSWYLSQYGPKGDDPSKELPAKPSDYGVKTLADWKESEPPSKEILYCRESGNKQDLDSQLRGSRRSIRELGDRVLKSYGEIGSIGDGKSLELAGRPELARAIDHARQTGTILVVPCISRLIRNRDYHPFKNPDAMPTVAEFESFLKFVENVKLATLNDPDSNPPADETFLRQLTADVKNRKVGRPKNKEPGYTIKRRKEFLPAALEMRADGTSLRTIARMVSRESGHTITAPGIRKWILKYANQRRK